MTRVCGTAAKQTWIKKNYCVRRKEILAQLTKNIEKQSITFFLKEKVTPKSVFFLSSPIKSSYLVEVLTEVSALIKVHAIPRNASVAAILKQVLNGQAAKRDVIPTKRLSPQA